MKNKSKRLLFSIQLDIMNNKQTFSVHKVKIMRNAAIKTNDEQTKNDLFNSRIVHCGNSRLDLYYSQR